MPEFIESAYVHRPVREADIPRRGVLSKRARGTKGNRSKKAPPLAGPSATMTHAAPADLWRSPVRQQFRRPVPPTSQSRFDDANFTPLVTALFVFWLVACCIFKIVE
jgi:hypothetical protein